MYLRKQVQIYRDIVKLSFPLIEKIKFLIVKN